jgi:Domain of unknown function (DUF4114)
MSFIVARNNTASELLKTLQGSTTGLIFKPAKFTGNSEAVGVFQDDPFGLKSGVVLSTGKVEDLPGQNSLDGGFVPPGSSSASTTITFEKLSDLTGNPSAPGTAIYRADLSKVRFDINSISISDGGTVTGGAPGRFSGFDLDGVLLSNTKIESAPEINTLNGLDVFDFSPARTALIPGTQRPPINPAQPDLSGTVNGNINNIVATLGEFDSDPSTVVDRGSVSLGDHGKILFNLKNSVSPTTEPLYLYIGESGDNGEVAAGQIVVSDKTISDDLSTDFGIKGSLGDKTTLEIEFDADSTAKQIFLQFVFGSEAFAELGGSDFNDTFSLKLNNEFFNLARLSDGSSVTINKLVPSPLPSDNYHPDFVYNPVGTGAASNQTKLDGYTKTLTFVGDLKNGKNTLTLEVEDKGDGLLDSAVFIKGGTLGIPPDNEPPNNPPDGLSSNNDGIVKIPGTSAQTSHSLFTLTGTDATFINEVGVFKVNDDKGGLDLDNDGITDLIPGDRDYTQAVLEQGKVIFSALPKGGIANATRILDFKGNDRLAFYLVQNSSTDEVLRGITPASRVFFGSTFGKGVQQLQIEQPTPSDPLTLKWEDGTNGGDRDFNDVVLTMQSTEQASPKGTRLQGRPQGELLDLRGVDLNHDNQTDSVIQGSFSVNSEAANDNFVGFYRVDNTNGLIGNLLPDDRGYAAAAIKRSVISFDRKGIDSVHLSGEQLGLLAPYIIDTGTPEQFLKKNPNNQSDKGPLAYFNYLGANPDRADHIRLLADNAFGFEDSLVRLNFDFNDMVVQGHLFAAA